MVGLGELGSQGTVLCWGATEISADRRVLSAIYLTFFYTKRELALRIGYLFVSAAIAGSLGGLLAYGIGKLVFIAT